jgi:hypothetical protein
MKDEENITGATHAVFYTNIENYKIDEEEKILKLENKEQALPATKEIMRKNNMKKKPLIKNIRQKMIIRTQLPRMSRG